MRASIEQGGKGNGKGKGKGQGKEKADGYWLKTVTFYLSKKRNHQIAAASSAFGGPVRKRGRGKAL